MGKFKYILEAVGFKNVIMSANFEFRKQPIDEKYEFIYEATKLRK